MKTIFFVIGLTVLAFFLILSVPMLIFGDAEDRFNALMLPVAGLYGGLLVAGFYWLVQGRHDSKE